jgi:UDP-perosamine 4-acetyltransferase
MIEVRAPRVNANDDMATLAAWHAPAWKEVRPGEPICSIETTKASVEIEADAAGFVYPAVESGASVRVGEVLAWIFPEKSEALLETARRAAAPIAADGVIVSAKARQLMDAHGLTLADFPGAAVVSTKDVEAVAAARAGVAGISKADVIAGLDVGEDALLIWGGGYQGLVVLDVLIETGAFRPVAVIDRNLAEAELMGAPVFRPEHAEALYARGLRKAHVCIGSAADKLEVAETLKRIGFTLATIVHPSAVLSPSARLGEGVFVGPQALVGMETVIDDLCQLNNAASVAHHSHIGRGTQVSDGARIGGIVRIGEGCLVGIGTVVNSRVTVGDWCTLVSGVTIYDDVEGRTIVRADGTRIRSGKAS